MRVKGTLLVDHIIGHEVLFVPRGPYIFFTNIPIPDKEIALKNMRYAKLPMCVQPFIRNSNFSREACPQTPLAYETYTLVFTPLARTSSTFPDNTMIVTLTGTYMCIEQP